MAEGFIKLHRQLLEWEWFTDINTTHLFLYCLLRANYENKKWRGIDIKRGSFITSVEHLSKETGLSIQNIRTSLNKLKLTNELTIKTTNRNSIISIKNYSKYQDINKQTNNQLTNSQQTTNKQLTTDKKEKKYKNNKNKEEVEEERLKIASNFYGEYSNVYLSPKNYDKMKSFVLNEVVLNELINELSETIASKSDRYKPYDENFPDAHFMYLKKFWEFRKNNPAKFTTIPQNKKVDIRSIIDKAIEEGSKKYGHK